MTDLPVAPPPKPKAPLWIKIVLAVSLVVNLGLAGMLAGLATRSVRDGSVVSAVISALPEQDRRALRREARNDFRALRGQSPSDAARQALLAALTADSFDPIAFAAALSQGRQHLTEVSNQLQARITARVAAMSVDERRAYAAELAHRLERRKQSGPPRP